MVDIMIDILFDPKVMTFVCFWWWAIGTAASLILTALKPVPITQKINWREPRDLFLVSGGLAWIAMWCFRTMY